MPLLYAILNSRIANILLALLIGAGWGWWKTDASWSRWEKAQEKIRAYNHQVELAREAANAVEIAKAATQRVEEDSVQLTKLLEQVANFDRGEANAKDPCLMDDRFVDAAGKLRQPPASRRRAKVARPPK